MEFGMLHLFENPVNKTEREIIKEQMELMMAAESMGFDSTWPAEHHFSEYGFCGSPQLTLAAIAERTSRIRLGTGVVVLPFHHPLRVAEDFAFLDQLSDGRVSLGLGRGYQPSEYKGFGVDQTASREIFNEGVEIIRQAWTQERVNFKGIHYNIEDLEVRPHPFQKPTPPMYSAVLSPESFRMAGRSGMNLMMSAAFGATAEQAQAGIVEYRAGRVEAGLDPEGGKIACLLMVYVADSVDRAHKEFKDPVEWYYKTIAKYVANKGKVVKGYEMYSKTQQLANNLTFEVLLGGTSMVCGDVDHCADRLSSLAKSYGFDELLIWTRLGGLDTKKVLRSMELLSDAVMPQVRKLLNT
jgi:natural product biosynthesis luciferase-like monooxygenase protein